MRVDLASADLGLRYTIEALTQCIGLYFKIRSQVS